MEKRILLGSIIAVAILLFPTSIASGIDETRPENIIFVNNLKIKPLQSFYRILLIGKISNKTFIHGWTPSYRFHIDLVLTLGNQKPFFQIIRECDAWIACPLFNGFLTEFFILGIAQDVFILP
ncbi:MAG: hypothetical protein JSW06_00565 [Thermoplasmatales archaeon]|nr:MAG: hypothetical protein JSW06_00565 [Thermoplasmatales archaeon]